MLSEWLELDGCEVHHAKADADLLIVQIAIISAERCDTVLVGDNTDPLVFLCYHAREIPFSISSSLNQSMLLKKRLGVEM